MQTCSLMHQNALRAVDHQLDVFRTTQVASQFRLTIYAAAHAMLDHQYAAECLCIR